MTGTALSILNAWFYRQPQEELVLLFSLYRLENWGLQRPSKLSRVIQPVSSKAKFGTQPFWTLHVCSLLGFVNLQLHRWITQRRLGRLTIGNSPTASSKSLWNYAHAILRLGHLPMPTPFYSLRFSLSVTSGRLPLCQPPVPNILQWHGYMPFLWLEMHDSQCKEEKEIENLGLQIVRRRNLISTLLQLHVGRKKKYTHTFTFVKSGSVSH